MWHLILNKETLDNAVPDIALVFIPSHSTMEKYGRITSQELWMNNISTPGCLTLAVLTSAILKCSLLLQTMGAQYN